MNSGKNKRRQLEVYDDIHYQTLSVDSIEEVDFINWLCEAKNLSVVVDFSYQPPSFNLFDSVKYDDINGKKRTLFKGHKYSTDFLVVFDGNKYSDLAKELKVQYTDLSADCSVWIDVKGTFNRNARSFSTDRKWVWEKFKIFINQLIPEKFFSKFGVPEKSKYTAKTKKLRSCYKNFKSLKEIFSSS